jgi:hypothetical protein
MRMSKVLIWVSSHPDRTIFRQGEQGGTWAVKWTFCAYDGRFHRNWLLRWRRNGCSLAGPCGQTATYLRHLAALRSAVSSVISPKCSISTRALHSLNSTIECTVEVVVNNPLPSLGILIVKRGPNLATRVYRKPIHTGRCLRFKSDHPCHVKRRVIHRLVSRAKVTCQKETKNLRHDFMLNELPK